jgi:6-pyruvoyltetrahydropterin/6-carboxytetrahydropterin synthase
VISVTRLYWFSASHRLHAPQLTDEQNAAVFGKCNNPFGHGHDYVLSVTTAGPLDVRTGLVLRVEELDALVQAKVLQLFAYSNMNTDIPQFRDVVPTTENVAIVIADLIEENWDAFISNRSARPCSVALQETQRNSFEVLLSSRPARKRMKSEGLLVHA